MFFNPIFPSLSRLQNVDPIIYDVLFRKRVRGFHQVSKHVSQRLETCLMNLEVRVFEITFPAKKISSNYYFNKVYKFKCHI